MFLADNVVGIRHMDPSARGNVLLNHVVGTVIGFGCVLASLLIVHDLPLLVEDVLMRRGIFTRYSDIFKKFLVFGKAHDKSQPGDLKRRTANLSGTETSFSESEARKVEGVHVMEDHVVDSTEVHVDVVDPDEEDYAAAEHTQTPIENKQKKMIDSDPRQFFCSQEFLTDFGDLVATWASADAQLTSLRERPISVEVLEM